MQNKQCTTTKAREKHVEYEAEKLDERNKADTQEMGQEERDPSWKARA